MNLNRSGVWLAAMLAVASAACSSSKTKPTDGGTGGAVGGAAGGRAGNGGAGGALGRAGGTSDAGGGASGAGGAAPTVVATLSGVPASLALDGTRLYATILQSSAGLDGKVQSVAKTATDATPDAGTVTTLASGLKQPGAIAVNGATVLWADSDVAFPGSSQLAGRTGGWGNHHRAHLGPIYDDSPRDLGLGPLRDHLGPPGHQRLPAVGRRRRRRPDGLPGQLAQRGRGAGQRRDIRVLSDARSHQPGSRTERASAEPASPIW